MGSNLPPYARTIGLAVLVGGIAVVGLLAGRALRGRVSEEPRLDLSPPPSHGLELGARFPTVALVGEDLSAHTTDALWPGHGAVVLFLDPECAPCQTMTARWQAYARSDSLAGLPLVGITYAAPPESIAPYRAKHAVAFPVYVDTAAAFLEVHRVTNVPLVAIVNRSGNLERTTFDPEESLRAPAILAALAR
jgi:hypothetical protein